MVSGLVTSPCDQLRIFSGDASMMRIASKSVMGLVSSNGFERNKATLLGRPFGARRGNFPGLSKDPSFPGGGVYRLQEGSEFQLLTHCGCPGPVHCCGGTRDSVLLICDRRYFRRGQLLD